MKAFLRRFASSLLLRVALALSIVGLVPVSILAYRLIDLNRDAMTEQVQETHARLARSTADQISAKVAALRVLARTHARNSAFADARSAAARQLLASGLQAATEAGVAAVALVNPEGEIVIKAQLGDERVRQWVDALSKAPTATEVHAEFVGNDFVARVGAPLDGSRGHVWLIVDATFINQALHNYELGRKAEVTLATRDGQPILGSVAGLSPAILERARSQWIDGVEPVFFDGEIGYIGSHAVVEGTEWVVLTRQPLVVAHQVAITMRENAKLAIAVVVGIVGLLSALAYASFVRPLRELAQAQRRLAGIGGPSSGGEIGLLRSSFEALEKRLKEQQVLDEVFLGRYQVRRVLGSGAMGTVFLGFDPKLERPVALKTVRLDRSVSAAKREEFLQRLVQEAVTTAKFSHPNIVAVYDVEDGEDAAFVAMELVDGTSLERFVWRSGRLDSGQTIALGVQIARGLAAAHKHGLVHRDIKPANILLGKDGSIKITDFGIAEFLSSIASREDVVFGTPGYLPPESLQGQGHDEASDLFALGAVLYFCITGERPFEGKTVKDVIRKTLFASAKPPSRLVMNLPPELESIVMSLLTSDRNLRPSDATLIADKLERLALEQDAKWVPPDISEADETEPDRPAGAGTASYLPTVRLSVKEVV